MSHPILITIGAVGAGALVAAAVILIVLAAVAATYDPGEWGDE